MEKSVSKVISDVPASRLLPPPFVPTKMDVHHGDESMEMESFSKDASHFNLCCKKIKIKIIKKIKFI